MIDGYAIFFFCFIVAGWLMAARHVNELGWGSAASVLKTGNAELRTMCILTAVWVGTLGTQWWTGEVAPTRHFILLDVGAVGWLVAKQTKNWQWVPASLFALMTVAHGVHSWGTYLGIFPEQKFLYLSILAISGILQILYVVRISMQRRRNGRNTQQSGWAFSTNWVLSRRLWRQEDARA